jgi:hypothetical protein
MAFREVALTEIREVLRAWLSGAGLRRSARRYAAAAAEAGLARDGGPGQLTDELVGQVAEAVRPVRPGGHGRPWDQLGACQEQVAGQVKAGTRAASDRGRAARRSASAPGPSRSRVAVRAGAGGQPPPCAGGQRRDERVGTLLACVRGCRCTW